MLYETKFVEDDSSNPDHSKIINISLLITAVEYIIQQMLSGFRSAAIDDPNITTSVAAQIQFIRIFTCNKWYDEVFTTRCNEIMTEINDRHKDDNLLDEINEIIAEKTSDIILNTDKFTNILNELSVLVVNELNNQETVIELNGMMPDNKIFKPCSFVVRNTETK